MRVQFEPLRRSPFALLTGVADGQWQRPRSKQVDVIRAGWAVSGFVDTFKLRL